MKRTPYLVALLASGLLSAPTARAITIDFVPGSQTVTLGVPVSVDVVISGLDAVGEIVGEFDLDATYDAAILSATGVTFGSSLGGPVDSFPGFVLSPGVVDFFEVSLLGDAELDTIQGDTFTLATLLFDTIGAGASSLDLVADGPFNSVVGRDAMPLSDPPGNIQTGSGSVTVQSPGGVVPEPSTGILLVLALAALAMRPKGVQSSDDR